MAFNIMTAQRELEKLTKSFKIRLLKQQQKASNLFKPVRNAKLKIMRLKREYERVQRQKAEQQKIENINKMKETVKRLYEEKICEQRREYLELLRDAQKYKNYQRKEEVISLEVNVVVPVRKRCRRRKRCCRS